MHVITRRTLLAFAAAHPDAAKSLDDWFRRAKQARWRSIRDVRRDFSHADGGIRVASGRDVTVFNIAGNKYRLAADLHYNRGKVFVPRVMTHADYDKPNWKDQL